MVTQTAEKQFGFHIIDSIKCWQDIKTYGIIHKLFVRQNNKMEQDKQWKKSCWHKLKNLLIYKSCRKTECSLKTEQCKVKTPDVRWNELARDTKNNNSGNGNIVKTSKQEPSRFFNKYIGEFDPGSGRTLAACLTHASRTGNQQWFLVANGWVTRR